MTRPVNTVRPGRGLILTGVIAAATVMLAVVFAFEVYGPDAAVAGIARLRPGFTVLRLAILALLIGGWQVWMGTLCRRYRLSPDQCRALLDARWRFAGFLLFVELAFVQGGLAGLFALFQQGA